MVLPDRPGPESNRPSSGRAIPFAFAAMVIVVGFALMGVLSPAEPVAVQETTTTTTDLKPPMDPENFTVSQIAKGEPLAWQLLAAFDAGYPIALTEHEGKLFLFASGTPSWQTDPGGLVAWKSGDGENWERIGEVVSDRFSVSSVVTTPQGLIAVGAEPGGTEIVVWRSTDGTEWTVSGVPTEADSPYLTPAATAVAASSDTIVISGYIKRERELLLEDRLEDAGIHVDLSELLWDTRSRGQEGVEFTVYGPLFTPALTTPLDELGLTDEETRWVLSGHGDNEPLLWVRSGDSGWEQGVPPTATVSVMIDRPNGGFLALGSGGAALPAGHYSDDGHAWTPTASIPPPPSTAQRWQDHLIGIAATPRVKMTASGDGMSWETVGPGENFPTSVSWRPTALAAGREGIAAVVVGQGPSSFQPQPSEMIVTSGEGADLTVDLIRREFVIDLDDETVTYEMQIPGVDSSDPPRGITVSLADELVRFHHPATGEPVATFSFDELTQAQAETFQVRPPILQHTALLFSSDGSRWAIQDVGPVAGNGGRISLLEVGAGHVTAVAEPALVPGRLSPAPGFEIWSAEIP